MYNDYYIHVMRIDKDRIAVLMYGFIGSGECEYKLQG